MIERIKKQIIKLIAWFKVDVEVGEIYCGNCHRYFERTGQRPTIGGPNSYLLKVTSLRGRLISYESDILVLVNNRAEWEGLSKKERSSLAELKYEIYCGHLTKPQPMTINDFVFTADAEL